MNQAPAVAPLDFAIGSQFSTRPSFTLPPVTLGASISPLTPIQVPAVGYLHGILLEVNIAGSGGTAPAWTADGPWNVIESITFRNPGGANLIPNFTGYQLFAANLLGGHAPGIGAAADPRAGIRGVGAYSAGGRFFLWVPIGIDLAEGYGAIPALASNANYQLQMSLAATATVATGSPTLAVTVTGTSYFFTVPDAVASNGVAQATTPPGMPSVALWNVESPTVSPGSQIVTSQSTGGVIRNHIFVLRTAAGARTDADFPAVFEMLLNNNSRFTLKKAEWEFMMTRWYGLLGAAKDAAGGLLTGVFALPYHALLGGFSGDPANTRAQLLPTISGTQVQFRFNDFGASASRLEILTEQVSTTDAAYLFSK